MEKEQINKKIVLATKIVVYTIALTLVLLVLFANKNSVFNIFGSEKKGIVYLGEFINDIAPVLLKVILVGLVVYVVSKGIRFLLAKLLSRGKKGQTAAKLIDSFLKYLTAILILILALSLFGVSTTTLLTSVGILGLIIGLGAQSLISDILSGLFIVFEGDYEVGDYIVIDGFRGVVDSIGIRTTKFVDYAGNIKVINNSQIITVINLSKEPSAVFIHINIKHEDFQKVEKLLTERIDEIRGNLPKFINGPDYLGPSAFTERGMTIALFGNVDESYVYAGERDLIRQVKNLFDSEGIEIPYPTYNINK